MGRVQKGYYLEKFLEAFPDFRVRREFQWVPYMLSEGIDDIIANYTDNEDDDGAYGRAFEVTLRDALTQVVDKVASQDKADIVYKQGVTIECKTGAGRLVETPYATSEQALDAFYATFNRRNGKPMLKASHVAYIPKFKGSLDNVYILTQRNFLRLLDCQGLIRAKPYSDGYKITIQNYLPTPNYTPSKERAAIVKMGLEGLGKSIPEFIEYMNK